MRAPCGQLNAVSAIRQQEKRGFRKIVLNPEDDLESLWAKAKAQKLTYEGAVELLKKRWLDNCGVSTVRDVVQGRGSETREKQLRVTLKEFLSGAESVKDGRAESASSGVEFKEQKAEYLTAEQWKLRALTAERELQKWKRTVAFMAEMQLDPEALNHPDPVPATPKEISEALALVVELLDQISSKPKGHRPLTSKRGNADSPGSPAKPHPQG